MQDIILVFKECGQKFVFSAEEQEFFAQRGITSKPIKCISCRKAKREAGRTQAMAEILHNPESHEVKCRLCGRVYVTMLKNVVHDVA